MSDIDFDCPHCTQHLVVDSDAVGSQVACPVCNKPVTIPESTPGLKKASIFEPDDAFQDSIGQIVALSCRNCGGQLDFTSGDDVATCPFCGSANILRQSPSTVEKLRDLEGDTLSISYFHPTIPVKDAKSCIVSAIKQDSAGFKDPDQLSMHAEGLYFPAWRTNLTVECSWHGEYSESRTITKWRKVTKYSGSRPYQENEPYSENEITWHPQNGRHAFQMLLYVPAAAGFSLQQLAAARVGADGVGESQGHPRSHSEFAVSRPCKSQRQAWQEFGCDEEVNTNAYGECSGCIERLNGLSAVVSSKEFSLIYFPVAVVSYTANDNAYRHFVNLRTGAFLGGIPLDHSSVGEEAKRAGLERKRLSLQRWLANLVVLTALAFAGTALANDQNPFDNSAWIAWFVGSALLTWVYQPGRDPWKSFLWSRRGYLLRLLLNPPVHLKEILNGRDAESLEEIRAILQPNVDNDEFETVSKEQTISCLMYAGEAVLQDVCPSALVSLRTWLKLVIYALFMIATALITNYTFSKKAEAVLATIPPQPSETRDDSTTFGNTSDQQAASAGLAQVSSTPLPQATSLPMEQAAPTATAEAEQARTPSLGVATNAPKEQPFVNSLGMKFVPIPRMNVLFSIWLTRVSDYRAFVQATGRAWPRPEFPQEPDHPAVKVSWDDANAFCEWLTQKERAAGVLNDSQAYRLPTDLEWSKAAGLPPESGDTPSDRDEIVPGYPWGDQWPPPQGAGNYEQTLHVDQYQFTSPVGAFPPDAAGLYDMGGNASQWCSDWYDSGKTTKVLRGSSWADDNPDSIKTSCRLSATPGVHYKVYGFRCVMASAESLATLDESDHSSSQLPLTESSPMPSAQNSSTPDNVITPDQVEELIAQNLRLSNHRDIDGLLAERGDRVDYFDEGVVEQDFIRSDMTKYFERWPYGEESLIGSIAVRPGSSSDTIIASFKTHFRVQNAAGVFIDGDNDNTVTLESQSGGLKIVSEKSNVTNKRRGHAPLPISQQAIPSQQTTAPVADERATALTPAEQAVADTIDTSMPRPNATPMPGDAPIMQPNAMPVVTSQLTIDSVPLLSPERVVSDVLNQDLRVTAGNFSSQYSGKVVRYTGTIVRKNGKEQLLVFKGGGFLTTAYDVQVDLNENATPGFDDVKVGDRITIVGTLDRIVPPPFGVGSNSIRVNDARIYKIVR